jgi:hypothetical protein
MKADYAETAEHKGFSDSKYYGVHTGCRAAAAKDYY